LAPLLAAPRFLNGRQREIWKAALASASPNLLKRCDRDMLASWVINVDRQRVASRTLDETKDPAEAVACHKTITETTKLVITLSDKLGFNPSAPLRVKRAAPPAKSEIPDSPWGELEVIAGGRQP
jgi:hypothetical protein